MFITYLETNLSITKMHRNNRYRGGRNFKSKFKENRYKSDIKPEQLTEKDVGITEYINELEGFSGILKARFSDFQVNEIDLDGVIAKFSDNTEPKGFDTETLNKEIIIPKESPSGDIPQSIWTEILSIMDSNEEKIVEFDSTNIDKEKRGKIYHIVKSFFQKKIVATTITKDNKKYVTFKKYNKEDKLDVRQKWPIDKGEYVHFLVYKENVDTLEAALRISDCLRMKASLFSYAGVKDRRGKTTQWFSVRRVMPLKLLRQTKRLWNIHIGNITFKNKPLKLGKLKGNRFRIALRNITATDILINKSMESLNQKGFINYYGLQRFGNDKEVPTYDVGIKLLLGKFKEACDLILKCKTCDNPDADLSRAKKLYNETGIASSAVELLKEQGDNCIESKLLHGLAKSNVNDYVNALENVPRNMRLLYIHSFQALIWNKVVSERIKKHGLCPIVGDLVILTAEENTSTDLTEVEETNEVGDECTEVDENNQEDGEELGKKRRKSVKILNEKDLENYTIYDIVLPVPGYDIIYPENDMKECYKNLLGEYGLSLEMPMQSVRTYTLSGDYRHIVSQVSNLSWNVMHYNNPNDDLIRSDFEEFLNKPEPVDKPDGQFKALVIDFCLNSSCYATMVVRDILKTDTSASAHTKLNDYHVKKDITPKITKTEIEATIDSVPNSLLADPAKYEDFKKSIFGFTSNDDSHKRKLQDENSSTVVPQKKTKQDEKEEKGNEEGESNLKVQTALA